MTFFIYISLSLLSFIIHHSNPVIYFRSIKPKPLRISFLDTNNDTINLHFNDHLKKKESLELVWNKLKGLEYDDKKIKYELYKLNGYYSDDMNKYRPFKDVTILSSEKTMAWIEEWVDMLTIPNYYVFLNDMFIMREFARQNTSNKYFYLGYYPSNIRTNKGPYYIGVFELVVEKHEFHSYMVIQNPNYEMDTFMLPFKTELLGLCEYVNVSFTYDQLLDKRYFYAWFF